RSRRSKRIVRSTRSSKEDLRPAPGRQPPQPDAFFRPAIERQGTPRAIDISTPNRIQRLAHDRIDAVGLAPGALVQPLPERLHGYQDGPSCADVGQGWQEGTEGTLG